jgi:hypothetical protein
VALHLKCVRSQGPFGSYIPLYGNVSNICGVTGPVIKTFSCGANGEYSHAYGLPSGTAPAWWRSADVSQHSYSREDA